MPLPCSSLNRREVSGFKLLFDYHSRAFDSLSRRGRVCLVGSEMCIRDRFGYCWFEGSSAFPAPDAEDSIGSAADAVLHLLASAPEALGTDPERAYLFGHSRA